MATKYKRIVDTTDNNRVYKIALKHYRAHQCKISCDICPYHGGENFHYWFRQRNWKNYRKTQYKVIQYDWNGE